MSHCKHQWIPSEGRTASGWVCNICCDYNGPSTEIPKMTEKQKHWLMESFRRAKYLSVTQDKPPAVVMRKLEKLGFVKDIMGTFWRITPEGSVIAKELFKLEKENGKE